MEAKDWQEYEALLDSALADISEAFHLLDGDEAPLEATEAGFLIASQAIEQMKNGERWYRESIQPNLVTPV